MEHRSTVASIVHTVFTVQSSCDALNCSAQWIFRIACIQKVHSAQRHRRLNDTVSFVSLAYARCRLHYRFVHCIPIIIIYQSSFHNWRWRRCLCDRRSDHALCSALAIKSVRSYFIFGAGAAGAMPFHWNDWKQHQIAPSLSGSHTKGSHTRNCVHVCRHNW